MKLIALLLGCLLAGPALASIGSVTELSGQASIKRGKETIAVTKGTVVEKNDKVETKNGKVKIVFKDDTQVSVTEHSSLVIDDFVYDPKSGKGSLGLKAGSGTVRYVSGAIAKDPKQVKINTPTAAIAVRGTDFIMSVNEIGSSMVILMPTCDWETSAVKGLVCGSGAIDVQSGPNMVSMNRPYQATLVENAGQPPTPPITVNLFGSAIGNNLQISPPRTASGASVVAAARAAAAATGATKENKREDKDPPAEEKQTADKKSSDNKRVARRASGKSAAQESQTGEAQQEEKTESAVADTTVKTDLAAALEDTTKVPEVTIAQVENKEVAASTAAATATTTTTTEPEKEKENPYLKKIWTDKSETKQAGWGYESLSPNSRNYANIVQPLNTQIQIVITQDMQTHGWNFSAGKPQGQIVINQLFR